MTVLVHDHSNDDEHTEKLPISLPDGASATFWHFSGGGCSLEVDFGRKVPNAYYGDPSASPYWSSCELFDDSIEADVPAPTSDRESALAIVAMAATSAFHEFLELVKLDDRRLATPHPLNEGEMWSWLYGEMRDLLDRYVERYPSNQITTEPISPGIPPGA